MQWSGREGASRTGKQRSEKRNGMDVPAQVVELGPTKPASPAMVRVAHARGSGLAFVTSRRARSDAPYLHKLSRVSGEVATPTARIENVRAVRTGGLQPDRSSVETGPTRAL